MSDHEAPTTKAPSNGTGSDEAPANETLERVDDAPERVDQAIQIAELEDAWRRTAAELDNFRKRCARDVVRGREQERAAVATSWLPVLDNLERALEHASSDADSVVEGVRAVLAQAVSTVSGEGLVPGTVAQVVRPGYGTDDKVLRPAAVVVATRAP